MGEKAIRISELPIELRELAELRRSQFPLISGSDVLCQAFLYSKTPDGRPFWLMVEQREWENLYRLKVREA